MRFKNIVKTAFKQALSRRIILDNLILRNKKFRAYLLNKYKYPLFDLILKDQKVDHFAKTLILLKPDAIGDYILFRNFLFDLKKSAKFVGYRIAFVGNESVKELAEYLDKSSVDLFIWINRSKFINDFNYRFEVTSTIQNLKAEYLINPVYSREYHLDFCQTITKYSGAKYRIAHQGDLHLPPHLNNNLRESNKYYNAFIPGNPTVLFEFYRNKEFFEGLLENKLNVKFQIDFSERITNHPYIILFPGAQVAFREWSQEKYRDCLEVILKKSNFDIYICGPKKDEEKALSLINQLKSGKIKNFCGNTDLIDVLKLIYNAHLIIVNESGMAHLAAALNKSYICISNGNHYGRFHPYPKEINNTGYYVYHDELLSGSYSETELKYWYKFESFLDINEIEFNKVEILLTNIREDL